MKSGFIRTSALIILAATTVSATACGGGKNGDGSSMKYPDFPLHTYREGDADYESWEDGEKSDLTIDWYVDRSTFNWQGNNISKVSRIIYENTGIKMNFITPLNDDGTMLTTILNSEKMPDLITINANNTTRVQIQEEGYVYPLNGLAERWAPTLFNNWDEEINYVYSGSDNLLYGIPSLYYTDADIAAFAPQGNVLNATDGFIANKKMLDWYTSTYPEEDPTKPDGFIKMCKAVKQQFNLTSTIVTDTFTSSNDNYGLYMLAQYFAVPREDESGNLLCLEEQPGFYDCIEFLNECYREGLISDANFSNTAGQTGGIIQKGECFIAMIRPQNYGTYTRNFAINNYEGDKSSFNAENLKNYYVGITITNENGDKPTISNLSGFGDQFTMVTKDCDRPDRVIKLLDYLSSAEGQNLTYYGVEGEDWNYEIQPGGTDEKGKVYKYGKIQWKDETLAMIAEGTAGKTIGISSFQLVRPNKAIAKLATYSGDEMYHFSTFLTENSKRVSVEYTYSGKLMGVRSIRSSKFGENYLEITTQATLCQQLWREKLATIISQLTSAKCKELYQATLKTAENYGYKDVLAYDNVVFKKLKEYFEVEHVYGPLLDGWNPPEVTSIYGNTFYVREIPSFIAVK